MLKIFWGQALVHAAVIVALAAKADSKPTEWPSLPKQQKSAEPIPFVDPISTLPKGQLYVVQHNGDPAQLLCSPPGLVRVKEFKGKVVISGVFVDAKTPGEDEVREYEAKQVFLVTRLQPGPFELLKVPAGLVERRLLGDVVPTPMPPGPGPTPKPPEPTPQPTTPVIAIDGVSVLILFENDDRWKYSKEWNGILLSSTLYTYLDSICAPHPDGKTKAWRMWDKDDAARAIEKDSTGKPNTVFKDAANRPHTSIPWAIISSRNGSYEGPLPADEDALKALIKKTIGDK